MANKISGRLINISPTQTLTSKSGNSYQRREFVIERIVFDRNTGLPTADPSDTPIFSLIGDNCSLLDNANIGDEVTIDYELRGVSYQKDGETKYFNDIRVFRIDLRGNMQTGVSSATNESSDPFASSISPFSSLPEAPQQPPTAQQMASDDLPF